VEIKTGAIRRGSRERGEERERKARGEGEEEEREPRRKKLEIIRRGSPPAFFLIQSQRCFHEEGTYAVMSTVESVLALLARGDDIGGGWPTMTRRRSGRMMKETSKVREREGPKKKKEKGVGTLLCVCSNGVDGACTCGKVPINGSLFSWQIPRCWCQ